MSAAILCTAKSYSISRPASMCDKKKRSADGHKSGAAVRPPAMAAALAEQELRLLGIRLPTSKSSSTHSASPTAAAVAATATSAAVPLSTAGLSISTPTAAAPPATACFGRSLDQQPRREVPGFGRVPALLADCCDYLRSGGHLDVEGLFRIEGSRLRLRDLRQRLERGCGIREGTPPQDVCSTLKAWLRELPEPLVPARMAFALAEAAAQASLEHRVRVLRLCGLLLSADQLAALQFLCCFLGEVSRSSQRNRMDANNLATSLGPSLLPIGDCRTGGPLASVTCPREVARLNSGVALLIELSSELGRWPVGLHRQQPHSQQRPPPPPPSDSDHPHHLHQLRQHQHQHPGQYRPHESDLSSDDLQRQRRRRSSGALGGALKAMGRAVSRLASRSRSRSPGRVAHHQSQPPPPQQHRPPRASPSPPAVRRLLHRLSAGSSSSGGSSRRGVAAVAPVIDHLPPLAPQRLGHKHPIAATGSQQHQPPPPPPLPPLSTLPSVSTLRTPLTLHHQQHHQNRQQQQQQSQFHRAASVDSPTYCSSASSGPLRAVHSIPTTPLRVLQSPLA